MTNYIFWLNDLQVSLLLDITEAEREVDCDFENDFLCGYYIIKQTFSNVWKRMDPGFDNLFNNSGKIIGI